jgi:hypothetical protein
MHALGTEPGESRTDRRPRPRRQVRKWLGVALARGRGRYLINQISQPTRTFSHLSLFGLQTSRTHATPMPPNAASLYIWGHKADLPARSSLLLMTLQLWQLPLLLPSPKTPQLSHIPPLPQAATSSMFCPKTRAP